MLLLRNASLYAPEPLGLQDLLVAGDRIAAIGPSLTPPPESWPCEVIDLKGQILCPGLIDLHTHMAGGGGEGGAHTRVPAVPLSSFTLAGVSTAIGLLGTDGSTRSVAELLACARGLEHLGLTALCYTGAYELPPPTITGTVRGDIVHIDRIVGVGELALSDHRSSQPTFDELVKVAADCHVAGMMTGKAGLLHLHLGDGRRGLSLVREALERTELPPRVFHPTHVNRNRRLWSEACELARQGGYIDVTAFPAEGENPSAAVDLLDYLGRGLPLAHLTLSSDGGGCLPTFDREGVLLGMDVGTSSSLLLTLREACALGLPLEAALATVTSSPAALYRLRRKGRLAVGMDADLLVLDEALELCHLWCRGRAMVRDGQALVRGPFERGSA
jgi:beta-aspartyl-dipeptidase (metallo-type)